MKKYKVEVGEHSLHHTIKVNGKGVSHRLPMGGRRVYRFGRLVLKLSTLSGQNEREVKVWKRAKGTEHAKHFARVVDHGMVYDRFDRPIFYVIQEYVGGMIAYKHERKKEFKDLINHICKVFGLSDMHDGNWKINTRGKPVIIDMGY